MSALKDACKEHLSSLGCTVWGEFFDIKSEKRLDEAADFLARHMRGVLSLRHERNEEPLPEYREDDRPEVEDGYDQAPELFEHGSLAGVL